MRGKRAIARAISIKFMSFFNRILTIDFLNNSIIWLREFKIDLGNKIQLLIPKLKKRLISIQQLSFDEIVVIIRQYPGLLIGRIKTIKVVSTKNFFSFLGQEVVANAVAWTAAIISSQLVSNYITVKSWKNGWGVFGKKDSTFVSKEAFEEIDWIVSYLVGLIMLLTVNYLMNQLSKRIERGKQSQIQVKVS